MWYRHTMESYSALKTEGNLVICNNTNHPGGQVEHLLSEISYLMIYLFVEFLFPGSSGVVLWTSHLIGRHSTT
jgi:hypothetical protein